MAALCVVAASLTAAEAQQTAPVTLESGDGTVSVTGNLISFQDGVYFIEAEGIGLLKIDAANIVCTGVVCPVVEEAFGLEFGIYGSRTVGTTLIPNLLRGYAEQTNARFEIEATADKAERIGRIIEADGSTRAVIDLQARGSGSAFPAIASGAATIGVADRRMKDSDVAKIADQGVPDLRDTINETVLGVDGIVLITHKDNPVPNLSADEVSRIWSGEITNWRDLGGGDYPITVNSFGEGSGDRAVMLDALVRPLGREETANVTRWKAYQDMVDAVMADRGGIGFVGRWLARTNDVKLLSVRESCGLLSPPTDFRMKIEGYSLSRRLYAYTKPGRIHPVAKEFLDWTLTPQAQPYIKEANFIDRDLERMRLEDMGMMLVHTAAVEPDFNGSQYSAMMRELRNADRLSISFRFNPGSAVLDVESIRNIEGLAARMEAGEFDGQEVMLVGFADSIGDQRRNTQLAQGRANSVQAILRSALSADTQRRLNITPLSYGELLPLSCNTDDVGRARNRRVEVWLRLPNSRTALR